MGKLKEKLLKDWYNMGDEFNGWVWEDGDANNLLDRWVYENKTPDILANGITLKGGGEEMLRVAADGFYIRGQRVEADAKEAETVYLAFKQWLTWAVLNDKLKS